MPPLITAAIAMPPLPHIFADFAIGITTLLRREITSLRCRFRCRHYFAAYEEAFVYFATLRAMLPCRYG